MPRLQVSPAPIGLRYYSYLLKQQKPCQIYFAVYAVAADENDENAHLVKVLVADKTEDFKLTSITQNISDRVFVASIDRNNNVSQWVQVKPEDVAQSTSNKNIATEAVIKENDPNIYLLR